MPASVMNDWDGLAPADELDDFQTVLVLEAGRGPLVVPHDFVVQLHCDPIPLQLEVLQQLHNAQRSGNLLRCSVNYNFHNEWLPEAANAAFFD